MEEDLILGEEKNTVLDIIENQVTVICSIYDIDPTIYPDMEIELKMTLSKCFEIINKAQKKILKDLK